MQSNIKIKYINYENLLKITTIIKITKVQQRLNY